MWVLLLLQLTATCSVDSARRQDFTKSNCRAAVSIPLISSSYKRRSTMILRDALQDVDPSLVSNLLQTVRGNTLRRLAAQSTRAGSRTQSGDVDVGRRSRLDLDLAAGGSAVGDGSSSTVSDANGRLHGAAMNGEHASFSSDLSDLPLGIASGGAIDHRQAVSRLVAAGTAFDFSRLAPSRSASAVHSSDPGAQHRARASTAEPASVPLPISGRVLVAASLVESRAVVEQWEALYGDGARTSAGGDVAHSTPATSPSATTTTTSGRPR